MRPGLWGLPASYRRSVSSPCPHAMMLGFNLHTSGRPHAWSAFFIQHNPHCHCRPANSFAAGSQTSFYRGELQFAAAGEE